MLHTPIFKDLNITAMISWFHLLQGDCQQCHCFSVSLQHTSSGFEKKPLAGESTNSGMRAWWRWPALVMPGLLSLHDQRLCEPEGVGECHGVQKESEKKVKRVHSIISKFFFEMNWWASPSKVRLNATKTHILLRRSVWRFSRGQRRGCCEEKSTTSWCTWQVMFLWVVLQRSCT